LELVIFIAISLTIYADYTAQLLKLLKKEQKWEWTEKEQAAFVNLRNSFASSIQLVHPSENATYAIYTDASKLGISAILTQNGNESEILIVSTALRVLSPTEQRHTRCEQELLAVVYAFQKFRIYVTGHPVIVYTDNKALSFLKKCQLTSSPVTRCVMQLQDFDLNIEHIKGTNNYFADLLSRNPVGINSEIRKQTRGKHEILVAKINLDINSNESNET
jgi:hypothetical protein